MKKAIEERDFGGRKVGNIELFETGRGRNESMERFIVKFLEKTRRVSLSTKVK